MRKKASILPGPSSTRHHTMSGPWFTPRNHHQAGDMPAYVYPEGTLHRDLWWATCRPETDHMRATFGPSAEGHGSPSIRRVRIPCVFYVRGGFFASQQMV